MAWAAWRLNMSDVTILRFTKHRKAVVPAAGHGLFRRSLLAEGPRPHERATKGVRRCYGSVGSILDHHDDFLWHVLQPLVVNRFRNKQNDHKYSRDNYQYYSLNFHNLTFFSSPTQHGQDVVPINTSGLSQDRGNRIRLLFIFPGLPRSVVSPSLGAIAAVNVTGRPPLPFPLSSETEERGMKYGGGQPGVALADSLTPGYFLTPLRGF